MLLGFSGIVDGIGEADQTALGPVQEPRRNLMMAHDIIPFDNITRGNTRKIRPCKTDESLLKVFFNSKNIVI